MAQFFKETVYSWRRNSCLEELTPIVKGSKNKNVRIASLEYVLINHKVSVSKWIFLNIQTYLIIMPRHKKWRGIMLYPPNF